MIEEEEMEIAPNIDYDSIVIEHGYSIFNQNLSIDMNNDDDPDITIDMNVWTGEIIIYLFL